MRAFPVIAAGAGAGIVGAVLTLAVVLAPAPDRPPVEGRLVANEQAIESTTPPADPSTSSVEPVVSTTTVVSSAPQSSPTTPAAADPTTTVVTTLPTSSVVTTPAAPPPPTTRNPVAPSTTRVHCVADPRVGYVCTGG